MTNQTTPTKTNQALVRHLDLRILSSYLRRDVFDACLRAIYRDRISDAVIEPIKEAFAELNKRTFANDRLGMAQSLDVFCGKIVAIKNVPHSIKSTIAVYRDLVRKQF